jgi:outer membrane protein assembly factor BamB
MHSRLLSLFAFLFLSTGLFAGENWPVWRGPRGDGSSHETGLPVEWSSSKNIVWKTKLPGSGYSSPVIWGDRIFVTWCLDEDDSKLKPRVLACLDRTSGKVLWEQTVVKSALERKHRENSYSSATPATDGEHVWVSFLDMPNMVVACYTVDGKEVWRKSPGKLLSVHGFCSPPVLYKDLVILNGDQDAEAYLVAYEKTTGKEKWRANRPNRTRSYCPPLIVEAGGKTQMVLSGSKSVTSYDPATGKLIWSIKGPTEQYVASMVYGEGLFFLTTGFPEYHLMAIKPDGEGDITGSEHIAWHRKKLKSSEASYVPSPIASDKYFFVVSDLGTASAYEAKTGQRLWMEKLGRHHHASGLAAEGRGYFTDDDGDTFVFKAGPKFELLARNKLGEECYSSPATAQGQLFIRTVRSLYCIGNTASGKK